MFLFLLILQSLVALALIIVILMQRSEGGGLAGGGSPSGLMTARGAADFLTRSTTILATAFVALSIILAALAASSTGSRRIDPNLAKQQPSPALAPATSPSVQNGQAPAAPEPQPAIPTLKSPAAPTPTTNQAGGVPIAQ
jgi:preprotein translocase subunit SecG